MKYLWSFTLFVLLACQSSAPDSSKRQDGPTQVALHTTLGTIVLQLSDSTPLHRDNFIKNVREGILDSTLFHRVIDQFMIQAGDPESKNALPEDTLGNGDLDYTVPAEIKADLFHKRGALGAARDNNPARASSAVQFYIVQRGPRPDSLIDRDETRINGWLAENYVMNAPQYQYLQDSMQKAYTVYDMELYNWVNQTVRQIADSLGLDQQYTIPETHRSVYRTLGGTPHLDQNYTVFGEVVSGMEIVDSIAHTSTNELDRPLTDIRILSAEIIK